MTDAITWPELTALAILWLLVAGVFWLNHRREREYRRRYHHR